MKRLLLAVGALVALSAASPATAAPLRCGRVASSNEGALVTQLRATNTTCHHARTLVHAWRDSEECYGSGIGGNQSCLVLRYWCSENGNTNTTTVVCHRGGGRRVTWRQHLT